MGQNKNPNFGEFGFFILIPSVNRRIIVGFDDFIKFLSFCLRVFNDMKTVRFWALWLIPFLVAFGYFISAIKWW